MRDSGTNAHLQATLAKSVGYPFHPGRIETPEPGASTCMEGRPAVKMHAGEARRDRLEQAQVGLHLRLVRRLSIE
jgi:hypothetical protein